MKSFVIPTRPSLWGEDLASQDLHARNHAIGTEPDAAYTTICFNRIKDLIDSYQPDLIFFDDNRLPLGDTGLNLAAHFYNANRQWHDGNLQAVTTTKGDVLFAVVMGWPDDGRVTIKSLAQGNLNYPKEIAKVELLGTNAPLKFKRDTAGRVVNLPDQKPNDFACCFKITAKP